MMKIFTKVILIYFVVGLLIYSNSLNNKFIIDDYAFIGNPVLSSTRFMLSEWNPYREQSLGVVDTDQYLGYYRPMAHMVLDFCYGTFKNNFWQYHLFNLILFVLASSLIYVFCFQLSGNSLLAFLTGLFYLIHPINGIVVNYISACVFALQVICMLGACILLLGALERNNDRGLYFLSLLASFLSLFWNESGILIPVYITALALIVRNDSLKAKAVYLFPYYLIAGVFVIFRMVFISSDVQILNQVSYYHLTLGQYLASLYKVLIWYISRLFYPHGIVMQWYTPIVRHHLILDIAGLGLLVMTGILLTIKYVKEKMSLLAVVWLLIGFLPVSLACLVKIHDGFSIEPHWFIFSSIGFYILAAYLCVAVLRRNEGFGYLIVLILVLSWSILTHRDNTLWKDQMTYALYWSNQVPNARIIDVALGDSYNKQMNYKLAEHYYKLALKSDFNNDEIYNNLGMVDYKKGNLKEADLNYNKALSFNPRLSTAYTNLGAIQLMQGQWKKARVCFLEALANNPLLLPARLGLAETFVKNLDYQQAIDQCLINLNIVNDDPDTLMMLVNIYLSKKDMLNVKKYAYSLIDSQADIKVLIDLSALLIQNNFPLIALDALTKALHIAPDNKEVYLNLGVLLANLGNFNEAIHVWTLGAGIDPSDQRFSAYIKKVRILKPRL